MLHNVLPQFLVLGIYEPSKRQGPAIWIKCMIARTLPEADGQREIDDILQDSGDAAILIFALRHVTLISEGGAANVIELGVRVPHPYPFSCRACSAAY